MGTLTVLRNASPPGQMVGLDAKMVIDTSKLIGHQTDELYCRECQLTGAVYLTAKHGRDLVVLTGQHGATPPGLQITVGRDMFRYLSYFALKAGAIVSSDRLR